MGFDKQDKDKQYADLAAGLVGYAMQVSPVDIMKSKRGVAKVAHARQVAMYTVYVSFGISLARVAAVFGRDRSTVAYACHQIEDSRDNAEMDVWLDALEETLKQAAMLSGRDVVPA